MRFILSPLQKNRTKVNPHQPLSMAIGRLGSSAEASIKRTIRPETRRPERQFIRSVDFRMPKQRQTPTFSHDVGALSMQPGSYQNPRSRIGIQSRRHILVDILSAPFNPQPFSRTIAHHFLR